MIKLAQIELKRFLESSGKTQHQAAKELGLSETVVSQFLSGKYKGSVETVAAQILSYIESGRARQINVKAPDYYPELNNTIKAEFAARYAHTNNSISLIYGAAGAGKTTALKHYAENNTGVVYITANASTRTARSIMYILLEAMGMKPQGTEFSMMRSLVERLKGTNRLVIIDEADHLNFHALQAVRNLNDEAGVGLVFSGNDIIKQQMYGRGSVQFDQLRTRVGCEKLVSNSYSKEEMRALFTDVDDDCIQYLLAVAHRESLRTAINRYIFTLNCCYMSNKRVTINEFRKTERAQIEGWS